MITENTSFIKTIKQRQFARYSKKGTKNIILAIILLFLIIFGGTQLGRRIWPDKIQNLQSFMLSLSLFIHIFFQIGYFLTFLPGYIGFQFYKNYDINKNAKKPWQKQNWSQMKKRTIFYLILNKLIAYPLLVYISLKISGIKTRIIDFPSAFQIFAQLIIVMYIEDFFFYSFHKMSHKIPFLYKYHKIHHEYQIVYSLTAQYSHPIDYVLGVLIPSAIPFIILGSKAHCFMFFFWQIWKIYVSSQGHSGYEFPWSPTRILPLVSGPSYHDFHHSKNLGNYAGSIYLWDTINNQNQQYWNLFLDKEKKQDQKKEKKQ